MRGGIGTSEGAGLDETSFPDNRVDLQTTANNFLAQPFCVLFGRIANQPLSASKANVRRDLLTNVFVQGSASCRRLDFEWP